MVDSNRVLHFYLIDYIVGCVMVSHHLNSSSMLVDATRWIFLSLNHLHYHDPRDLKSSVFCWPRAAAFPESDADSNAWHSKMSKDPRLLHGCFLVHHLQMLGLKMERWVRFRILIFIVCIFKLFMIRKM